MTAEVIWDFAARRHAQRADQDAKIIEEVIIASLSTDIPEGGERALFTSSLNQSLNDRWKVLHEEDGSEIIMLPCDSE